MTLAFFWKLGFYGWRNKEILEYWKSLGHDHTYTHTPHSHIYTPSIHTQTQPYLPHTHQGNENITS